MLYLLTKGEGAVETFFSCKCCNNWVSTSDCVTYDIVDTINGRLYQFECPYCGIVQTGEIVTEYSDKGETNAFAKN